MQVAYFQSTLREKSHMIRWTCFISGHYNDTANHESHIENQYTLASLKKSLLSRYESLLHQSNATPWQGFYKDFAKVLSYLLYY